MDESDFKGCCLTNVKLGEKIKTMGCITPTTDHYPKNRQKLIPTLICHPVNQNNEYFITLIQSCINIRIVDVEG